MAGFKDCRGCNRTSNGDWSCRVNFKTTETETWWPKEQTSRFFLSRLSEGLEGLAAVNTSDVSLGESCSWILSLPTKPHSMTLRTSHSRKTYFILFFYILEPSSAWVSTKTRSVVWGSASFVSGFAPWKTHFLQKCSRRSWNSETHANIRNWLAFPACYINFAP